MHVGKNEGVSLFREMIKGLFIWRWGTPGSIRSIFNLELNVKSFSVAVVLLLFLLSLLLCCCLC